MASKVHNRRQGRQEGAALIEFAVTVSLFLVLVLAIAEFSILMMNMTRANELTRRLNRIAIVGTPVCDIFGGGCNGTGAASLSCPGGADVVLTLNDVGVSSCNSDPEPTECQMYLTAQALIPSLNADQIEVTYACSDAGSAERPQVVPYISVAVLNYNHQFALPGLFGIPISLNIPDFEITRTGEDLYTERN